MSRSESAMPLDHYITLGRSGLRVSPFCLGTMTCGEDLGWGVQRRLLRWNSNDRSLRAQAYLKSAINPKSMCNC